MPREAPVTRAMREARGRGIDGALSSSLRTQGPIRRGGVDGERWLCLFSSNDEGRWLWVPAFAGTTCHLVLLARFRQQRKLPRLRLDLGLVGEMGRIDAGEAMVGEFRIGGIAARLAHRAVHAVDREERQ